MQGGENEETLSDNVKTQSSMVKIKNLRPCLLKRSEDHCHHL